MVTIYENKEKLQTLEIASKFKNEAVPTEDASIINEAALSEYTSKFLRLYKQNLSQVENSIGPTIQVSAVLGKLARLYERIRTIVEYKGEHVLRRNAIERIIKRLIWEQGSVRQDIDTKKVAETLIKELIWAHYLPNNSLPLKNISVLQTILEKYLYLLRNIDNLPPGVAISKVRTWFWGVASSEVEDILDPSYRELYVQLMYDWFNDFYNWKDNEISEHDKNIQIYLAIHRAYMKSDEAIMRYHLLLLEFPDWREADKIEVNKLIVIFPKIYQEIESHLNFYGRLALYRKIQRNSAAFDIFHEIATSEKFELEKLVEDKELFEENVRDVCESKYRQINKRVNTGIVRSIIYIFLTKVLIAMIIEIPYELVFLQDIRSLPLTINILIPPILMWLIGLSIKVPGAKNTELIIQKLQSVVYNTSDLSKTDFSILKSQKKSNFAKIFGIFYAILFILVFGGVTYVLALLNFTIFSTLIFFMFLSAVLLFAFRIRYHANQLRVESGDESFWGHIVSYLTLPFLNFGFYLSRGLAKINFLTIILDFLIEIPLKNVIEIFEEWTSFLREKREEVIEIPE